MIGAAAELAFLNGPALGPAGVPVPFSAVAVRARRIVATGAAARERVGPRTEVIDLAGRLLLPGFIDAHAHPVFAGIELGQCDLSGNRTREQYLATIADYAHAHPHLEWITGAGWSMEAFPGGIPHRRDLDAAVGARPVYLPNRDHHGAWVSSRALELAGIDAATPEPTDGRIERDPDGSASGMLQEGACELVARLLPALGEPELDAALLRAQNHLHALGVTGWQDAIVGSYLGRPDPLATYLRAADAGRLTARVVGALWWDRNRGVDQVAELIERRDRSSVGSFRATTVKIMQDGVAETQTAAMLSPYLDACGCQSTRTGSSFVDPAALCEAVIALDAAGFQVHVHALGDRAVREALDALQAARERNGPSDRRHHLAHLQVVHPADLRRFAALDVIANIQPLWACHDTAMDELTMPYLGAERTAWQYPFAALLAAGARLAAGSDWPVTSADPLEGIHVAVNRVAPGQRAAPFLPEQRLPLLDAVQAYTAGSAAVNHRGDTGTIAVGAG